VQVMLEGALISIVPNHTDGPDGGEERKKREKKRNGIRQGGMQDEFDTLCTSIEKRGRGKEKKKKKKKEEKRRRRKHWAGPVRGRMWV